ncbi:MAG: hypothetical protein PVH00_01830 [Gemmatimonadota bacterium]|jgi:hypothetical protein
MAHVEQGSIEIPDQRHASTPFRRRLVRLVLQHGRVVEGNIHVTEGQALTTFVGVRPFVSLTEARWVSPEGEVVPHLAVRSEQVLWTAALDDDIPVCTMRPPTSTPRWAELTMKDGTILHVGLYLADEQRLTDYVDSATGYLPVLQGSVVGQNRLLGPVAVNKNAILAIREIEPRP